jgi:valyl-tRNA synthetase
MQAANPLPKRYDPGAAEQRWYSFWLEKGYFQSTPDPAKKPYTIVIPPPNVTGALHMGHALNNTLQDVLIRWRRMQGFETLWLPGTDHAGIATQSVVEKQIYKEEKKSRHDLGRDELLRRIWEWKDQYGERILMQLRKLGSSCDWTRTRFTMDDGLSRAVRETFVRLYKKGLVYRGRYLVNWCPALRTAISDDEVDHKEVQGHLWYIKYRLVGEPSRSITIATTRPETMLGDTAVAVHPEDERYRDFVGRTLVLPLTDREIPVIADKALDRELGTGALKVTPAHDPVDFEIGERHGLPKINILNEDGTINENGGPYAGLPRFEARERVLQDLTAQGLLEKVEDHVHQVGHCSRTGDVIEPYLSLQWFVKMKPLAEKAIAATTSGRVKFHPERWNSFYMQWLENVRDWCISRQLWWGHQIPIWYAPDGTCFCAHSEEEARAEAETKFGKAVTLTRDPDVLDTWFSSQLWPFSTLGWPDATADLDYYYPTSTLVTDRGIIFFWVARMVMAGEEMCGREPFRDVYINGTILDKQGRKMSKSLGNGIDPVVMIDGGLDENTKITYKPHGADGVRFSLTTLTTEGQDLKLWPEQFDDGQRFLTKLWNAGRFSLGHLEGGESTLADGIRMSDLCLEDRWIVARLDAAVREITDDLEGFRYCDAARRVRSFIWDDFCDWYVEVIKLRFAEEPDSENSRRGRRVLAHSLDGLLRLLHPICPFITEEIWQLLGKQIADRSLEGGKAWKASESIVIAPWPDAKTLPGSVLADAETFAQLQEIVRRVRKIRQERNVSPAETPEAVLTFTVESGANGIIPHSKLLQKLARLEKLTVGTNASERAGCAVEVLPGLEVIVPLPTADPQKERETLDKKRVELANYVKREEAKLSNASFVEKAPVQVVEATRERMARAREQLDAVEAQLKQLNGGGGE